MPPWSHSSLRHCQKVSQSLFVLKIVEIERVFDTGRRNCLHDLKRSGHAAAMTCCTVSRGRLPKHWHVHIGLKTLLQSAPRPNLIVSDTPKASPDRPDPPSLVPLLWSNVSHVSATTLPFSESSLSCLRVIFQSVSQMRGISLPSDPGHHLILARASILVLNPSSGLHQSL